MRRKVPEGIQISGGAPLLSLVCLVVFVDTVGYGVVVPVLPVYARTLNVSDFAIGFLFATYAIALLIGAIPMGMLSDRLGRKWFVLFGMFAMSGAFIFYAFASSYPVMVIARVLDGLTAAATWSAGLALVSDRFDESVLGARFGYVMSAMAVGAIAGPLVGGVFSDAFGHRAPFFFVAALCFLGGTVALFLKEEPERLPRAAAYRDMMKGVLGNRVVMLACVIVAGMTFGLGILEPMLPNYLKENFELSGTGIGLIFGATMLTFALTSPLFGWVSDRVGRRTLIIAGLAMTASVVPFLALTRRLAVLYILMGALGVAFAVMETPALPLVTDSLTTGSDPEGAHFGTAYGLLNLFWSLGYAAGPLIGGALTQWAGLSAATCVYSGLLLLLLIPAAMLVKDLPRSGARVRA